MELPKVFTLAALFINSIAHSWINRFMRINSEGTMVGPPRYIREELSRDESSFSDFPMLHLLPPNDRPGPQQILAIGLMRKST